MLDGVIKKTFFLLLFALFAMTLSAQNAPVNVYASILDSMQRQEQLLVDSMENVEFRYYVPDSILSDTTNTAQLRQMESYIDSLSLQVLEDRNRRPEPSDLLRYIRRYDIMKTAVHPIEVDTLSYDTEGGIRKMSPLFMPLVFNAHKRVFRMSWRDNTQKDYVSLSLKGKVNHLDIASEMYVARMARQILLDLEVQHLDLVKYREKDLPAPERLEVKLNSDKPIRWTPPERRRPMTIETAPVAPINYSHWVLKGRFTNQLTQTYVSKNWSSGGSSNMSSLHSIYWSAKYNDGKNIQFDNVIDMKIGLNTTESDTLRKININNDQFQLSSKLGVRAVKNWYYSISAELMTQFLNNYKQNTYTFKSSFLSPAKLFISMGMDYKVSNIITRGSSLSVLLTPLTYRLNYLRDIENFKPSSYGVDEGKHFGSDFGFKVATTFDYKITDDISWNSYIYYYSDFSYVDSEWKNTINFAVNQYLSTQLFIHLKMNDKSRNSEYKRLVQLKEYLSFGFVYYW